MMIEDLFTLLPQSLLDVSGSVFYSGRLAFSSRSALYVLGLNPGGNPESQANETVAWHSMRVLNELPEDWSAYRDESWQGSPPGTRGMQPRVLHLMRQLGLSPGLVPASNVVFKRSKRENTLSSDVGQLADKCWPFHAAALDALRPRVLLCFGKTAGNYVRNRLAATSLEAEFVEANDRKWRTCVHSGRNGIRVVTATHPSIADWTSPSADPSPLIGQAMAG